MRFGCSCHLPQVAFGALRGGLLAAPVLREISCYHLLQAVTAACSLRRVMETSRP